MVDPFKVVRYAALIAQMLEWRNDPKWVDNKSHRDRWDRALKAFGSPVEDPSLTPMKASEADENVRTQQAERWSPVAAALHDLEGD